MSFHSVDALTPKSITLTLIPHQSTAPTVIMRGTIICTRGTVIMAERIIPRTELPIIPSVSVEFGSKIALFPLWPPVSSITNDVASHVVNQQDRYSHLR